MSENEGRKDKPLIGRPARLAPELRPLDQASNLSIEKQAYNALRHALMSGAIVPGAVLTIRSISAALNISATPVREALKRLDADGILVSRSKSGFYVADPSKRDFSEMLQIRLNLEGLAIRLAAENAEANDIDNLDVLNQQYRDQCIRHPGNSVLSLKANFQFHFAMYKLSQSRQLVGIIETFWLRIGPVLHRSLTQKMTSEYVSTIHTEMLDALRANDPTAAERALHKDLMTAAAEILPTLRSETAT